MLFTWASTNKNAMGLNLSFHIRHIGNSNRCLEVLSPSDQAIPFAHSCSFTLHTSYTNEIACLIKGGKTARKFSKPNYYESSLVTDFVQTYSLISITMWHLYSM